MSGLREKQKADRDQRILKAATRLFREVGYDRTKIETIAAKARVSIGTVYNYYQNKGDLLVAISDREIRKPGDLTAAIYLSRPGETLRVTVLRDGQSQEVTWQLPPRDEGG